MKVLAQQVAERLLVQQMRTLGQATNGVHAGDILQEIHVGLVLANSEVLQVGTRGNLSQGSAACRGINDSAPVRKMMASQQLSEISMFRGCTHRLLGA